MRKNLFSLVMNALNWILQSVWKNQLNVRQNVVRCACGQNKNRSQMLWGSQEKWSAMNLCYVSAWLDHGAQISGHTFLWKFPCGCSGWERVFKSVDFEWSIVPFIMWVGLVTSVDDLHRTKTDLPWPFPKQKGNSAGRGLWTWTATLAFLWSAGPPCRLWTCHLQ